MGRFIDSMERMKLSATCEDELLACDFTVTGGHSFKLGPGYSGDIDSDALEDCSIELIKAVRVEYSFALNSIRGQKASKNADAELTGTESWLKKEWLRHYREALSDLEVHTQSSTGTAQVWLYGDGDVDVLIRPQSRSRESFENDVIKSLTEATNAATNNLWRANVALRREIDEKVHELTKEMDIHDRR